MGYGFLMNDLIAKQAIFRSILYFFFNEKGAKLTVSPQIFGRGDGTCKDSDGAARVKPERHKIYSPVDEATDKQPQSEGWLFGA